MKILNKVRRKSINYDKLSFRKPTITCIPTCSRAAPFPQVWTNCSLLGEQPYFAANRWRAPRGGVGAMKGCRPCLLFLLRLIIEYILHCVVAENTILANCAPTFSRPQGWVGQRRRTQKCLHLFASILKINVRSLGTLLFAPDSRAKDLSASDSRRIRYAIRVAPRHPKIVRSSFFHSPSQPSNAKSSTRAFSFRFNACRYATNAG